MLMILTVFVAVYDAPFELLDDATKHCFSYCGTVLSARCCKLQDYPDVYNGIRVFKCDLDDSIPSFLRFGPLLLRVKHPNQTPTCRKCNYTGHIVKECPNQICFNCEGLGHMSRDCPNPVHCVICHETGHNAVNCRFSWKRRPAHHTADEDDFPPAPPPASHVPDSEDVIPPTQPSQPMQSSQSSQPSQPLQPLQPLQPSPLSTTDSDVLLAAAASLPSPDVAASPEPSPSQSSGSSTTTTATSGSSSSCSTQPTSCSTVPDASPDAPSQDSSSSPPLLFSSSTPEPVPAALQPPSDDVNMNEDAQSSALGVSGFIKAVSRQKRKSAVPVLPNRRPAKVTNADVPPTRTCKSTAPKPVSSRKKS